MLLCLRLQRLQRSFIGQSWGADSRGRGACGGGSRAERAFMLATLLFTHRDLWAWLEQPFEGPPEPGPAAEQAVLSLG